MEAVLAFGVPLVEHRARLQEEVEGAGELCLGFRPQPAQCLQVAEPAPGLLEVRFEVDAGVPETPVTLGEARGQRRLECPPVPAQPPPQVGPEAVEGAGIPADEAGVQQGRGHRGVRSGEVEALWRGPHGVAELETGVPQGVEQGTGGLLDLAGVADVVEQEEVDVGVGGEFPATVAAHGHDGEAEVPGCRAQADAGLLDRPQDTGVDGRRAPSGGGDAAQAQAPGRGMSATLRAGTPAQNSYGGMSWVAADRGPRAAPSPITTPG